MNERFVPTAEGLVAFAKEKLHTPNIYLWDGVGEYLTDDVLDRLIAADPVWYTPERIAVRRTLANSGIRGWDCIGLIIGYKWGDYHQGKPECRVKGEHWSTAQLIEMDGLVKGSIDTLPERPGLVLFKKGHVGVYIGDGRVIECTNRDPETGQLGAGGGIVETALSDVPWTHWLEFPGICYE